MKKIIISIIGLCCMQIANAQSVESKVIASGGTQFKSANAQVEFTVGETFTNTLATANNKITQGFHQAGITVARIENANVNTELATAYQLNVYPNPVTDFVNLTLKQIPDETLRIEVINQQGQLIYKTEMNSDAMQIDFTNYKPGVYVITVINNAGKSNSYKVIKGS